METSAIDSSRTPTGGQDPAEVAFLAALYCTTAAEHALLHAMLPGHVRAGLIERDLIDERGVLTPAGVTAARWQAFAKGRGPDPVGLERADTLANELRR